MKKILLLLTVIFVLPKEQPLWPGMIVRCEQSTVKVGTINGQSVEVNIPDPDRKLKCHWECEFGETTETYVEEGTRKVRATGCAGHPAAQSCPNCPNLFYNNSQYL